MKSLKMTLSVHSHQQADKSHDGLNSSLLKGVNKSKSHSVWTLDVDNNDGITEQSLQTDRLLKILNDKLQIAFRKNKTLNQIAFERLVEEFQDQAGGKKSQLAYLMLIQDKLLDLFEFARQDFKPFLTVFSQILNAKIAKIRAKEKKVQLNKFENIAKINFKKRIAQKTNFSKADQASQLNKSKQKRKANDSIQKLNKLLSIQKKSSKEGEIRDTAKNGEDEKFSTSTLTAHNQSISFSTALATTIAVKTRRRKDQTQLKKQKGKVNEKISDDTEKGDEAFIFYRPKKHRK